MLAVEHMMRAHLIFAKRAHVKSWVTAPMSSTEAAVAACALLEASWIQSLMRILILVVNVHPLEQV